MIARKRLGVAAIALGAAIATTGGSAAGDKATPKLLRVQFAQLSGEPIRGLVVASQRPGRRQVKVHVSLHGRPLTDEELGGPDVYRIAADHRPCSIDFNADGDTDAADFLTWTTSIIMANTEGDVHVRNARLRAPLKSARSIRVLGRSDGGQHMELACGRAQGWATFPSD